MIKTKKPMATSEKTALIELGRNDNRSKLRSECESKLFEDVVLSREIERQMMVVKRMGHF